MTTITQEQKAYDTAWDNLKTVRESGDSEKIIQAEKEVNRTRDAMVRQDLYKLPKDK